MAKNSEFELLEQKDERSFDEDQLEQKASRNLDEIVQELDKKALEPPKSADYVPTFEELILY